MGLNESERQRYVRQLALPELGEEGQSRLAAAAVLVVGAGGLGSPAAFYLAAAGVGRLGLVDNDAVELGNLQRQILHGVADVGRLKVESAAEHLGALNPGIRVEPIALRFGAGSVKLAAEYDFLIDATDTFDSKFRIADVCHAGGIPYSHAGISGFIGQTLTVIPGQTSCYRCLFESAPAGGDGAAAGPVGFVPGVIGAIQAGEAIKYVAGFGRLLTDRLLIFDALSATFRTVELRPRADCELCGGGLRRGSRSICTPGRTAESNGNERKNGQEDNTTRNRTKED